MLIYMTIMKIVAMAYYASQEILRRFVRKTR